MASIGGRSERLSAGPEELVRTAPGKGNWVPAGEKKGSVRKLMPSMLRMEHAVWMWVIDRVLWQG